MRKLLALFFVVFAVFFLSSCSQTKGYLFVIGSGRPEGIMRKFIEQAEKVNSGKIVIFPMSSSDPDESGKWHVEQLKKFGAQDVEYHVLTKEASLKEASTRILDNVGGIYFSGGDQTRLADALVDTPIHRRLLEIYENGGVIGGSSAGAAVMSEIMITGEEKRQVGESSYGFEVIKGDNIVNTPGFGFIKTAIIDQHFVRRIRHNRLISLVAENPHLLGIGIDESTAIIVTPNDTFEVDGAGNVIIYDMTGAEVHIDTEQAIRMHNGTMHILKPGDRFDLKTRRVLK
jgi:cyanophycinase